MMGLRFWQRSQEEGAGFDKGFGDCEGTILAPGTAVWAPTCHGELPFPPTASSHSHLQVRNARRHPGRAPCVLTQLRDLLMIMQHLCDPLTEVIVCVSCWTSWDGCHMNPGGTTGWQSPSASPTHR